MSDAPPAEKTWLNGLLFVLTCLTACVAGGVWSAGYLSVATASTGMDLAPAAGRVLSDPRLFPLSALYAAVLMTILVGHELGHYLTCRRYGIRATVPFFLPGPPFLGTFGAFIRIKSPIFFRRQLFDVGANGPLVGFALTLPALAAGLALSRVAAYVPGPNDISFGEPILFRLLAALFFGRIPEGSALVLHPVGWAGWVGLLITSVNLMPLSQLDGGHVAYALFGRKARPLSWVMVGFFVTMGLFFHLTWLVLVVIILLVDFKSKPRLSHPPVVDEGAPLGWRRRLLGALIILIFVLSFIPAPTKGVGLIDLLKGAWGGP